MAKADAGQVRALATAYAAGSARHGRALALQADASWAGPDVVDGDGTALRVVPCRSPLAVREALLDHPGGAGELLVVLTPCSGADLGIDVRARLVRNDVLPLDPFGSILALFRATVVDPALVAERWLIDDLIALAPSSGWSDHPAPGGVLDADLAWRVWHQARLGIGDEPADLADVLAVGERPEVASAIAGMAADRRERLAARWERKELVLGVQEKNGIPQAIAIVIRSGQQILLAHDASRFLKKVEFDPPDQGDVCRMHPAGRASPVVIDPLVRFGRPSVLGVSTERLWELFDAGESVEEIAGGYDMATETIRAAIAYEEQQRSLAA